MDFEEFKIQSLGIDKEKFGRIFSFIDFGNVNYWFKNDIKNLQGDLLSENKKLTIDIEKFSYFLNLFSERKMFYYGVDPRKKSTWHINKLARNYNFSVISKPIQWIKQYLDIADENIKLSGKIKKSEEGFYLELPKCNFDVELTIDAIRLSKNFDTFALFSGDSDFSALLRFMRKNNKKILLFYSGRISHWIEDYADLLIKAQDIKGLIVSVKEKNPD